MESAVRYYEAAVASYRIAEDFPGLCRSLATLSNCLPIEEMDRAESLGEEALRLARNLGSAADLAYVEGQIGSALFLHGGDLGVAQGHLKESLRLARAIGADWAAMFALEMLALTAQGDDQHEATSAHWQDVLPLAEMIGDRTHAANAHIGLARNATAVGDPHEATKHWRKALDLAQELGSASATAPCLAGIAVLLCAQRYPRQAARLLAASELLRDTPGQISIYGPQFQAAFAQAMSATRTALSVEAFDQAWAEGQVLSLEQASDLALATLADTVAALPANDTVPG
jgi:tetratricopeptide (TPR) repeat protein